MRSLLLSDADATMSLVTDIISLLLRVEGGDMLFPLHPPSTLSLCHSLSPHDPLASGRSTIIGQGREEMVNNNGMGWGMLLYPSPSPYLSLLYLLAKVRGSAGWLPRLIS